jgi:regulator of sigma E protease
MSWIFVFLGFSLLIVIHEAGHFFAAKATGMRVERFFLFFGPTLFSVKRGETEYGVKAIPLGGYVKISGMNSEEELPPEVVPRAYCRQPVWKRIVVIGAGPAVNIALAFVILFFVAFNYPEVDSTVGAVKVGSPAAAANLEPGDRIVSLDGRSFSTLGREARLESFAKQISSHHCAGRQVDGCRASTPVAVEVRSHGKTRTAEVYPAYDASLKRALLGIEYATMPAAGTPGGAVAFAGEKMWLVASGTFHVFSHIFESKQRKEISGIVGVSDVGHQTVDVGVYPSLLLLALVSLSLGLINLLPILPLDGGHIFWSVVEKLRGEPVPLQVMERASIVGFALVAMLFFIGLNNDIGRIAGEGFNSR